MQKEMKFDLGGKSYTVKFPNVGKIIDMESLKQAMTANKYGSMSASGVQSMYYALDLVDAIVFFKVNMPKLVKDFEVEDLTQSDASEVGELVEVYKKQIFPWYTEIMKNLYNYNKVSDATTGGDKSE